MEHYRRDMENHITPRLGAKPLTQLTAADLRKLYDTLKQNGRVELASFNLANGKWIRITGDVIEDDTRVTLLGLLL